MITQNHSLHLWQICLEKFGDYTWRFVPWSPSLYSEFEVPFRLRWLSARRWLVPPPTPPGTNPLRITKTGTNPLAYLFPRNKSAGRNYSAVTPAPAPSPVRSRQASTSTYVPRLTGCGLGTRVPVSEGVVTPLGGWTPGPITLGCLDRGVNPP